MELNEDEQGVSRPTAFLGTREVEKLRRLEAQAAAREKELRCKAEEAEALPRLQPAPGRYRRAFERLHGFERFAGLFFQVHSKPRGVVFKVGWHRGE